MTMEKTKPGKPGAPELPQERLEKLGESSRTPECVCPSCGKVIDAATGLNDASPRPKPGDVTICVGCGEIMAFADDLTMRALTDEEAKAVAGNPLILDAQKALGWVRQFQASVKAAEEDLRKRGKMMPRTPSEGFLIGVEYGLGAKLIPLGSTDPIPFPESDWIAGIVSELGDEIRIVGVIAKEQRKGALTRLVQSILDADRVPVIVQPTGPFMPEILKHWGWRGSRRVFGNGESHDEWRPPGIGGVQKGGKKNVKA